MTAVIMAPCLKVILWGAMFEKALAGATMFAAKLVVKGATVRPAIDRMIISGPPIRASSATGSAMRVPKSTIAALETAAPIEGNHRIVTGNAAASAGTPRHLPQPAHARTR